MKKKIHLLACSMLLVLSGCGTLDQKLYDGYSVPPLDAQSIKRYAQLQTNLENTGLISQACFAGSTEDKCKAERNQTIAVLSVASASLCQKYRQSIYGRDAASNFNITFSTLTNLFAGAGAAFQPRALAGQRDGLQADDRHSGRPEDRRNRPEQKHGHGDLLVKADQ